MTPRQLLDIIDTYLADRANPLDERRAVWDLLTALRGCDRKRDRKKIGHTVAATIRAQAFPKTARMLARDAKPGFRPKFDAKRSLREVAEELHDGGGHYHTHAWRALLALAKHGAGSRNPLEGMD